jgi:hypothetical protein
VDSMALSLRVGGEQGFGIGGVNLPESLPES